MPMLLMTMSSTAGEPASEPEPAAESADETTGGASAPSPLIILGAAFVAGIAVARWLDWRERARAAV